LQRGTITNHNGEWTLIYYDTQFRSGKIARVQVWKKLARVSDEYPSKASVRQLADEILAPLNKRQLQPESSMPLHEFIENRYFPGMEQELRPSTIHNYRVSVYNKHLKKRLKKLNLQVRDFRTVHAQRLFRDIPDVGHVTLLHIKNFLSGVFKFALRDGVVDGVNPIHGASVPGRAKKFDGTAYTMDEVFQMIMALTEDGHQTAVEVVYLMALTGVRQSEARGLRWSDWDEKNSRLHIRRSVWGDKVGPTKNPASEDSIPVLGTLTRVLAHRRERVKPDPDDYIFAGKKRGQPLDFHNLINRQIKPSLKNVYSAETGKDVKWTGFHGFRRGLASNLFALGVNPKIVGALLRHQSLAVTLQHYIKTPESQTVDAMTQFEKLAEKLW
jgi:integrase